MSQYMPTITSRLSARLASVRVNAFRRGDRDINAGLSLRAIFGRK